MNEQLIKPSVAITELLMARGFAKTADIQYEAMARDMFSGKLTRLKYKVYPDTHECGVEIWYYRNDQLIISGYWTDTEDFLKESQFKI
jgi:hypothetical protein